MLSKEALGISNRDIDWKDTLNNAGNELKLNRVKEYTRIYEGSIKLSYRLFANEIDKHNLLRILQEFAEQHGYDIIAFSLLDDELRLLLAMHNEENKLPAFLEQLNVKFESYFVDRGKTYKNMVRETPIWEVPDDRETLLQRCYEIHTLATKSGYTKEAGDFWWSSYNSYGGHYIWEFVNIWYLLSIFSGDPKEAWSKYQKDFRRRREMDRDYTT